MNVRLFWLIFTTLLVFQVGLALSQDYLIQLEGNYHGLAHLNSNDWAVSETASYIKFSWEVIEGNPSITSFVIDSKSFLEHPVCHEFVNCDFFPYPSVTCQHTKTCQHELVLPTGPDLMTLAIYNTDTNNPAILQINVEFRNDTSAQCVLGEYNCFSTSTHTSVPILPTPTVIPHPINPKLSAGDITSDGYANCGTVKFNDFRVWYSKEQNSIEFYAEGNSQLFSGQAKFIVYFDAKHIIYKNALVQVNGPFELRDKFLTEFDDIFPDKFFNTPGTGAYAILTLDNADFGCVTAPVGSQSTEYSTAVSGVTMFIALAFLLLSTSLLFLSKDVNYSIYPKKWFGYSSNNGGTSPDEITDVFSTDKMAMVPSLIPKNAATAASDNSSLTKTPSIYDLISVAQWIVTTALLTLPNLPTGYRQFASNFGWSTGTGGGINVQDFSNDADNLRMMVCHLPAGLCTSLSSKFDTCKPWFNSDITPNHLFTATDGYFTDPTGFDSYSNTLHISNHNIFFVMFAAFLLVICSALIIVLLIGIVTFYLKEKWVALKKTNQNIRLIMRGAILRVIIVMYYPITLFSIYQLTQSSDCWLLLLLASIMFTTITVGLLPFCIYKILFTSQTDYGALWNKEYKIPYGILYSDYLKDRVWFVIPTMAYQLFRSLLIPFAQHSGAVQLTGLIALELVHFVAVCYYKPFARHLANILNLILSAGRLIVLFLLIPFLGGNIKITSATRISLTILLIVLQSIIVVCVGGLIFLNIISTAFKFFISKSKKNDNVNEDDIANEDNNVREDADAE